MDAPLRPQSFATRPVESIRETAPGHQDYTSGSLNRAILLPVIPMVLEMVLESLFAVVDVFFVGRIGANAVCRSADRVFAELDFRSGHGLSMSTTALVARRIRSKHAVAGVQASFSV